MAEFASMPLFTDAYLADTRHLSTTEHGAYLLLLMVHWRIGEEGLPDDERLLARYAGLTLDKWRRLAPTIRQFFIAKDGRLLQARLLDEIWHAKRRIEKSASGGNAKALKYKQGRSARSLPKACLKPATLSLIPTLEKEEPNGSSKKRGQRLADDWLPSTKDIEFATKAGHDPGAISAIADEFRDYWHAQPGQRGVKLDWEATWRNWIRREGKRSTNGRGRKPKFVSDSGFEYFGSLEDIRRKADQRHDMKTYWAANSEIERLRTAAPAGTVAQRIVERVRH